MRLLKRPITMLDWILAQAMSRQRLLGRPGGRTILGLVVSAHAWRREGIWVPVRWQRQGYWLLSYPDASVPLPEPDMAHYRRKEGIARDAYFHRYQPRPGDVVVHVGAGAGWEANLFSRLVGPGGRVYLIEAHPKTYRWLILRVAASGIVNARTINIAVSDEPGVLRMSDVEDHMTNQISAAGSLDVAAKTLAQIFSEEGIEHVDLLTMNIEGAERAAIRGLGPAAAKIRRLAVSCHDFLADRGGDDWTRTKAEVQLMLEEYGFKVSHRDPADLRDWTRDYLYASRD